MWGFHSQRRKCNNVTIWLFCTSSNMKDARKQTRLFWAIKGSFFCLFLNLFIYERNICGIFRLNEEGHRLKKKTLVLNMHMHTLTHVYTDTHTPYARHYTWLWNMQKTISQHPALNFATIKRPPKHLHLSSDPACDNRSESAVVHSVMAAWGQVNDPFPPSFLFFLKAGQVKQAKPT